MSTPRPRFPRRVALAAALVVLLGGALWAGLAAFRPAPPGAALAVRPPERYVALGDSYAAGPGIPTMTGVPLGCARSSANYPELVRSALPVVSFRDATCGGATTADMTRPQPTPTGPNPPQLDALSADSTLVTLTLGGNDIGYSEILDECLARSPSQPNGAACRAYYQRGGRDLLAERVAATAPKLAAVLARIHQRAPGAKVLVVGYPTILPASGPGCPEAPFSAGDVAYLDQTFQALNAMVAQVAEAAGDRYVDTAGSSAGHDVCAAPGLRWVEGRSPTSPAAAFHPNAAGMRNSADQVLAALRA